jgi:hypothetical protein
MTCWDALDDLCGLSRIDWKAEWGSKDPLGRGRPTGTDKTVGRLS